MFAGNMQKEEDDKQASNRFSVWITTEPCDRIPDFLFRNLHKLAWNHITMDIVQADKSGETKDPENNTPFQISFQSPQTYLHTGE